MFAAREEFAHFKRTHKKHYASAEEEEYRFGKFQDNLERIAQLNTLAAGKTVHGVNKFADLDPVEFKRMYLNYRPTMGVNALKKRHIAVQQPPFEFDPVGAPSTSDWRGSAALTPVKDQGQCGSCWAFSATETAETYWYLNGKGAIPTLAPQQTVSCDTVDQGCNGGDTVTAYAYMETTGLQGEATYPYTSGASGVTGSCAVNKKNIITTPLSNFTYATPGCLDSCTKQDEVTLAANVKAGPVSICVDASTWQTYTSGVLTGATGCQSAYTALDHCVQLVGLKSETDGSFSWIVRNSWAADWGEAGFIRLSYGANTCGVADEATIVSYH